MAPKKKKKKAPLAPRNPFAPKGTKRGAANQYTRVENRILAEPKQVQLPRDPQDPYLAKLQKRNKKRAKTYIQSGAGKVVNFPELGESVRTDDPLVTSFKNEPLLKASVEEGPAINEPHTVEEQMPVARRAEDLTGLEVAKANAVLKQYGLNFHHVKEFIKDSYRRAEVRAMVGGQKGGQYKLAGAGFYAGPSNIRDAFNNVTEAIKSHPNFKGDDEDALAMSSIAHTMTSPRTPVISGGKFANSNAAMRAAMHALDVGSSQGIDTSGLMGFSRNIEKAADAVAAMNYPKGHPNRKTFPEIMDPTEAPKTSAFGGAQMKVIHPTSFRVSDVHSAATALPFLSTSAMARFIIKDKDGNVVYKTNAEGKLQLHKGSPVPVVHEFDPEDLNKNGLPKPKDAKSRLAYHASIENAKPGISAPIDHTALRYERKLDDDGKPETGSSPVETTLSKGGHPLHAVLDLAARHAAYELGISPSVHHAQATHLLQEVDWQDQRIIRPDIPHTMESEYPGYARSAGGLKPSRQFIDEQLIKGGILRATELPNWQEHFKTGTGN